MIRTPLRLYLAASLLLATAAWPVEAAPTHLSDDPAAAVPGGGAYDAGTPAQSEQLAVGDGSDDAGRDEIDNAAPEADGSADDALWDELGEDVDGDEDTDALWDELGDDVDGDEDTDALWDEFGDGASFGDGTPDEAPAAGGDNGEPAADDYWDQLDAEAADDTTDWDAVWGTLDAEEAGDDVEVPEALEEGRGGVRGVVLDDELGEPIAGADVSLDGVEATARTSAAGEFFFALEPATYVLRVRRFGFNEVAYEVLVDAAQVTDLASIRLRPSDDTLTVVVEGRAVQGSVATQLMERREATTVQDAIGREQMSRSTDSAASAAVRRVVGVTILEDRFLVVRGLGGRYTAVTLNGVAVPRTDPDYPGVELDIFPTDLLSSITLAKSPSAGVTGGFVGGLMDIETRAYPERRELSLGVSLGANSQTTFQRFRAPSDRHAVDWFAMGASSRALPYSIPDDRRLEVSSEGVDTETYDAVVDEFPSNWGADRVAALPSFGVKFNAGDSVELGERRLGYLLALTYDRGQRHERGVASQGQLVDGELTIVETLDRERYDDRVAWGALANVALEVAPGHDLRLVSLLNRAATHRLDHASGLSDEAEAEIDRTMLQYVARTLWFNQVLGRHRRLLPETSPWHETRVDWNASASVAARDEPDTRDYATLDGRWDDNPGTSDHLQSDLEQRDFSGALSFSLPLRDVFEATAGADAATSERTFASRRFHYQLVSGRGLTSSDRRLPPNDLFTAERTGAVSDPTSQLTIADQTRGGDAYRSTQTTLAAHAAASVTPAPPVTLTAGARYETFEQTIRDTSIGTTRDAARRVDNDLLPSASAVLRPRDNVYVRAVYGASVARPQVREVAPFVYQDYVRRRTVTGNADLDRTYVHNTDLRTEWFPSATEVLAFTLFNKTFRAPIEMTVDRAGAVNFVNADAAQNYGAELEVQLGLGRISERLRGWSAASNVSLIRSRVDLPCDDLNDDDACDLQFTELSRPMAGQAPWVVNASFGYEQPAGQWSVFAYYNVLGATIVEAGINDQSDTYERPMHGLDLAASLRVSDATRLKFGARNVAARCAVLEQDGLVVAERCRGADASVSLTWEPGDRRDDETTEP